MATPPTILADATKVSSVPPPAANSLQVPVEAKFPLVPFLIAVVAGVVIAAFGFGSTVLYLTRTGRLPGRETSAHKDETVLPTATHTMVLDPLLVNLSDAGENSYLRVAMTLRVVDAAEESETKGKEEKPKQDKNAGDVAASVRDTLLTVLGRQTANDLLATDGKEKLKAKLKAALAEHNADLKVTDVFFTDFLVQR